MIYRYLISFIIIFISIFLVIQKPEKNVKNFILPKFSVSQISDNYVNQRVSFNDLNDILSQLKAEKGVLIEHFKVDSNYNFLDNKNYSVYIKRDIPQNIKYIKDYEKINYKSFDFLDIDMDKIWKNSINIQNSNLFEFSGVIRKNNEKRAYIYFKGLLKEVKENSNLGDFRILKIYDNGILLFNEYEKRFEVLR